MKKSSFEFRVADCVAGASYCVALFVNDVKAVAECF